MTYAIWGYMALAWWTWPAMFAVVMLAVYAGLRLGERSARLKDPRPCNRHVATDSDGFEWWCQMRDGHDGECGYGAQPESFWIPGQREAE